MDERCSLGSRPEAGSDGFIRPNALEAAAGWVYGRLPGTPCPPDRRRPREALDDAIRPALANGPCYVTFSGGRDSSAVLAAAASLARREGFEPPIPVTRVYPDIPETDESAWQRDVIEHLGLTDWLRFEFRAEESELLGEAARESVRARGVLWPPALHTHGAMFKHLRGGSLLTGEGGDAVLGSRRSTPLHLLLCARRRDRPVMRAAALASLPRPILRRALIHMSYDTVQQRWLRPAAMKVHAHRAAADAVAEPLRYDAATWSITRRRSFSTISHNHAVVAAEYGILARDPLLDTGFVAALARSGGIAGYAGRTATMKTLFADVLPSVVLCRSTKAAFNRAHRGNATREFARSWDGSGVDADLVDVEKLREVWLSDRPTMATGVLLHSAWLASAGPA